MELTVAKRDLLRLVTRMQGVAERKSTMPALSNVLLSADGSNALRLAATDLYLAISGKIAATVSKGGGVAVPAKDLFERVKMMPDGPVHIATHDNATTTLKAAGSARRYTLRGMPGDDFPPLPSPAEGAPTLALEVEVLRELIDKTYFSVSTDETRAHLNSALFEWEGDVVRMVTTDGHRLSKMEVKIAGRQASATMLIPLKAILELRRLCDDVMGARTASGAASSGGSGSASGGRGSGARGRSAASSTLTESVAGSASAATDEGAQPKHVGANGAGSAEAGGVAAEEGARPAAGREPRPQLHITQSASSAFFQSGDTTFSVKLVDAQFPPYAQVIPQASEKKVRAPRAPLADALRAVAIAASERTGGVRLALTSGTLRISSESPESGDGSDEVPVDYTGQPITIGFNAKYFLDILGALEEEDVVLGFTGELDPAVVRPDSEREFLAVVMPMRI